MLKLFCVLVIAFLSVIPAVAAAQSETSYPGQTRIHTGAGLVVTGVVFCTPLSIYLLAGSVSGGPIPGAVVGGIGVVSVVAGIFEIVGGVNQRRESQRVAFTGDGVVVRW